MGALYANLADLETTAAAEEPQLAALRRAVAPAPVVRVPVLRTDVLDLCGLEEVGHDLFGSALSPRAT